jgi:hypothetical protein
MTLEKSEMLRISKQDFLELGKKSRGQAILRVAAEASFVDKQKQQIDLVANCTIIHAIGHEILSTAHSSYNTV